MRVVALISGGKDSCYNMMKCIQKGHDVVALANLYPIGNEELDSYMFQSVGHQVINLYSEAVGVPLYRHPIKGTSKLITSEYLETEGDEVEDLYQLLLEVKTKENIEAVSVGAILSSYQKTRVEHVCKRLNLVMLAYLWNMDQSELLDEMLANKIEAIIIKVAALGLNEQHLGKTLSEMKSHLQKMNEKFGLNVCGEGGEYETLTLDCPLFKKKIVIKDKRTIIHSNDAFAPVAYLVIKEAGLVSKLELDCNSPKV